MADMPRPADVGQLLLGMIPRAPEKIDTPRLVRFLAQQGIKRTPRAVQGMLKTLAAEHPIRCIDATKPYQWQWDERAPKNAHVPMDAHTALTLKLAYAQLAPLLPISTLELLKTQMRRADEVLAKSSPVASWAKKVRVFPRGLNLLPPKIDREALRVVYDALLTEKRFSVTYVRRGRHEDETFDVNPLALVARGSLLTLVCTIGRKTETRQLHLHRMKAAKLLATSAFVPNGFDLDAHIAAGNLSFRVGASRVRLRARFDALAAQTLEETPLASDQRLGTEADGRVLLEATVADTLELRAWLASYGPRVEVIEPEEIREQLAEGARATAALYGATASAPPPPPRTRGASAGADQARSARGGA